MENDPETWRWIWLVTAIVFAVGEITTAGSFFLLPFAIGAITASVLAFAGVGLEGEWIAFVAISLASLAALRPLARRLDESGPSLGIGAHRQLGQRARVTQAIDGSSDHGFVMLGAETWRAESADGTPIPVGAEVLVAEVRGTRVLVTLLKDPQPLDPGTD